MVLKSEMEEKKAKPKLMKKPSNHMVTSARLPQHTRDSTDRNRTSPFAFTGNKFEFRAVGSSQNVSIPMTAVNSATACALQDMNEEVRKMVEGGKPTLEAVQAVTKSTLEKHLRIVYNGDNYT